MSGFVCLLAFALFIQTSFEYQHWRQDRQPKIRGAKIPFSSLATTRRRIQRKIVRIHNYYRTKVAPPASNMLRMKWNPEVAEAAQRWSNQCLVLVHDNETGRHIDDYGACGQNIFIATDKVPWVFAITTWFLEKDNFTFAGPDNHLEVIGHYTQMVWASTHQVGCGVSRCSFQNTNLERKTFYNYICNYCPIGNRPGRLGLPYRRGKPCGRCQRHCFAKRLCTNACPAADYWGNCRELYKLSPRWLCDPSTAKGRERRENCRATCSCRRQLIHD